MTTQRLVGRTTEEAYTLTSGGRDVYYPNKSNEALGLLDQLLQVLGLRPATLVNPWLS